MRRIISMIPNAITSLNVFCGCIAVMFAFSGDTVNAFGMIVLAAVFDFLDGFAARLLKAYSPMGKELDSLADMVSFGVAPAAIAYTLGVEYIGFLIAIFSGLRLAKFNVDERQTSEFIGLPTPANALFFSSIGYIIEKGDPLWLYNILDNQIVIAVLVVLFSLLLVCEIRMFSLKFKSYKISNNKLIYSFLLVSIALIILLQVSAIPFIILLYIVLSIIRHFILNRHN